MMNLRDYLYINGIKISDFARSLGASRSYMNQVVLGRLKPSKRLAKSIEMITEHNVTAEEMLKGDPDNGNDS